MVREGSLTFKDDRLVKSPLNEILKVVDEVVHPKIKRQNNHVAVVFQKKILILFGQVKNLKYLLFKGHNFVKGFIKHENRCFNLGEMRFQHDEELSHFAVEAIQLFREKINGRVISKNSYVIWEFK